MSRDPYKVLGVTSAASEEEVRAAYKRLVKIYHPDRNPGDQAAEEKFKDVSAAFDLLGDAEKRARYDRGEIDAEGNERGFAFGQGAGGARGPFAGDNPFGGGHPDDISDIFSDLFGGRRAGGFAARGGDMRYQLVVDFLDAVNGAKKRVTMPDGKSFNLTIPAGLRDGQVLRLRGQGAPGRGGGPAGDAYIECEVGPHPLFERRGDDIHIDIPISVKEAVLGGKITIPTISGEVAVTAPKGSNTGSTLRLKGKGAPNPKTGRAGDQYVRLKVVLPEGGDAELEDFIGRWSGADYNPRQSLMQDAKSGASTAR